MKDFFKGWEKKLGVVTLLMALVAMCGWVMSLSGRQTIPISSSEYGFSGLDLFDGILEWESATPDQVTHHDALKLHNKIISLMASERDSKSELKMRQVGRYYFRNGGITLTIWLIPYWLIVIPLTLLSACLLVSKPLPSKQKKIAEPITVEGGAT